MKTIRNRRHLCMLFTGVCLLSLAFHLQAALPVITSFAPMSGPTGAVMTITGANFGATAGENIVWFGAVRATMLSFGSAKCSQYPIT